MCKSLEVRLNLLKGFLGFMAVVIVFSSASSASANLAAQDSVADAFEKAAAREKQVIDEIAATNKEIQSVQAQLHQAESWVIKSNLTIDESRHQQKLVQAQINDLEAELATASIEGFVSSTSAAAKSDQGLSLTQQLRAESLLGSVQKTQGELISELRLLRDHGAVLEVAEDRAREIRDRNVQVAKNRLQELKVKKSAQNDLYSRVKQEADNLEAEARASKEIDAELRALIAERQKNSATIEGPLRWPIASPRITSSFGNRRHPIYGGVRLHAGIDVCPSNRSCSGAPIVAAGPGTVIFAGFKGGYGRTVIIDHGGGITTLYAHMSSLSTNNGAKVLGGQAVGKVGSSGNVTGAHLHFEVRSNGTPKNPRAYIK